MTQTTTTTSELPRLVAAQVPADVAPAALEFARAYVRRLSLAGDASPDLDELVAEAAGAFRFMADRRDAVAARAFDTPRGSVLETNTEDLAFLVDSVTAELEARGHRIRRIVHPIVGVHRGPDGELVSVGDPRTATDRESVMHFELDHRLESDELTKLEAAVREVLTTLRQVVLDFPAMLERLDGMVRAGRAAAVRYGQAESEATGAFLTWLADQHFVLIGFRQYLLADRAIEVVPGSGLGLLADETSSSCAQPVPVSTLPAVVRRRVSGEQLLVVRKTRSLSPVRHRVPMDEVSVRHIGPDGSVLGEARLLGLFTPRATAEPASRIPVLDRKLAQIVAAENLVEGSHDHSVVTQLFDSFPKDELFAAPVDDLRRAIVALLTVQGDAIAVFGRHHASDDGASLIVTVPRAEAGPDLRQSLTSVLGERYDADRVTVVEVLAGDRLQLHVNVRRDAGVSDATLARMRETVTELARSWRTRLSGLLTRTEGWERAEALVAQWAVQLPRTYRGSVALELAAADVLRLDALESDARGLVVGLDEEIGPDGQARTRVALCKRGPKIELSQITRVLEDAGLRVIEEASFRLDRRDEIWVQGLAVLGPDDEPLDLGARGRRLAEALTAILLGDAESDPLDRLLVLADLDWRQIEVLRAYRRYRQRAGSRYPESFQNDVICAHADLTAMLVELFERRFDPARERDDQAEARLREEILERIDAVELLDHDRILRNQLQVLDATTRTNAYRPGRGAIAFKLRSAEVPAIPKPAPLWEIYVYSREMQGIHLRAGAVARGGIRWSDRMDFRTEVMGLLEAQITKNAVIVPTGAKGGFLLRAGADEREAQRQYVRFIEALLDVTDDLVDGTPVHPEGVRVLDEPDTYLVVAADKGTAAFSDLANEVAMRRGFWLGDAFASGGSTGYDHKRLGITARGAWESVKRHFYELGRDPAVDHLTAVGIGDMSGDVFGNGLLLSSAIKLVAAYDHRHIFIDPDPDPAASYAERQRLFELPRSSWASYDRALISAGGGVWPRERKSIPLSDEMRELLGVDDSKLTPAELIRAILRAPVDLLWNGGIGTVVKASTETHADAQDRSSDAIRVDARDLRCQVVGEGGNLGLTQRARIEFAAGGGRVNADFVDNSGGVNCSDREVNLKILLNLAVSRGELDARGRLDLLAEVTDEVVALVLRDSYRQARVLSQEARVSADRLFAYDDLMDSLQTQGYLDRAGDALPNPQEMAERRRAGRGMQQPELAVLLAHSKRSLVDALLRSDVPDEPSEQRELQAYFPERVSARFASLLADHPLRRELIATVVANHLLDSLGPTFVSQLVDEYGVAPARVVRAARVAGEVAEAGEHRRAIEGLEALVTPGVVAQLTRDLDDLVHDLVRWYLAHSRLASVGGAIASGQGGFQRMRKALIALDEGAWHLQRMEREARLVDQGVPIDFASEHALLPTLVHAPEVGLVASSTGRSVEDVTWAFSALGDRLALEWLKGRIDELPAAERTQRWALRAAREDLLGAWSGLARHALEEARGVPVEAAVEEFVGSRAEEIERLHDLMGSGGDGVPDLAQLMLAGRHLRSLAGPPVA